jgi:hypothetical protein
VLANIWTKTQANRVVVKTTVLKKYAKITNTVILLRSEIGAFVTSSGYHDGQEKFNLMLRTLLRASTGDLD